jgi:TP901 family phage tail tape measure protein
MSSSSIRAGGVAIEIGADVRKVFAALNAVQARLNSFGQAMAGVGVKIAGLGTAASVPFAAAIRSGAGFESTLLNIKASAGVTEAELDRIRSVSLDMSKAMAMGPAEVATSFLELLKSGMRLEDVLGGAGKVAVQFAKVGSMELGPAAVALSDAMNVFGVSAGTAAAAISSAADASSTSIELLTQSFSMVSAVAAQANQSLDDTSAALAVLANAGVKGSDAGTSLKTMLLRLMAPADDAVAALTQLGLSTQSFRGADGRMKPLAAIIDTLNDRLQGMDQAAKDDVFRRIFGSDAIRAAAILTKVGSDGLAEMGGAMRGAMPLGQKFDTLMSGLAGTGAALTAALQRAAVAITAAVGPSLSEIGKRLTAAINGMTKFATANADVVVRVAKVATGVTVAGGAFVGLGLSLKAAGLAAGGLSSALSLAVAPVSLLSKAGTGVVSSFARVGGAFGGLTASLVKAAVGFAAFEVKFYALSASYVAGAMAMALRSVGAAMQISAAWAGAAVAGLATFAAAAKTQLTYYTGALASVSAATISRMGVVTGAWVTAGLRGVGTFVATTLAGVAGYVSGLGAAVAATATSMAAMAAAWIAPVAPILGLTAAVGGVAYAFSKLDLKKALSGLPDVAGPLAYAFGTLATQAATTFGEVYSIADTTFQGIYEAIAAGDMSQAFTVLWAGLRAAWVTGSAPIFGAIDQLTEYFQGVWGDAITWLAVAITKGMGVVENIWEASTRSLTTAWSVAINSVMDIWDTAVGAIQKAIAYIRSFLDKSIDYKAVRRTIDEANKERKDERDRQVAQRDPAFARQMAEREQRDTQTIDTLVGDNEREKERRAERSRAAGIRRQEEAAAAGAGLAAAAGVSKERKFVEDAGAATSIDQLRELYAMAEEAMRAGKITGEQFERVQRAIDDQQLEVDHNRALADQEARQQEALSQRAQGMESAAAAAGVETSGTFSTAAAAMLGQGGSLAERTAKAVEDTARNTKDMADGGKVLT